MRRGVSNDQCRFAWVGLATSDPRRASAFYAGLFGWQSRQLAADAPGAVTVFTLGADDIAILYAQTPQARAARVTPHWTPFIGVRDAAATASSAVEHGATVIHAPFDVLDYGRLATLRDPLGSIISCGSRGRRPARRSPTRSARTAGASWQRTIRAT